MSSKQVTLLIIFCAHKHASARILSADLPGLHVKTGNKIPIIE